MSAEHPPSRAHRLPWLDALRGFALLGVWLVNLRSLSLHDLSRAVARPTGTDWLDIALATLVDGKSFTLFTLLFGVGFALQMENDSPERVRRFARRLGVLLIIGLLHAAFWWGDILRLYAVLGLLLLPLRRLRPWMLAVLGVVIAVGLTPVLRPWMAEWLRGGESDAVVNTRTLLAFRSGSFAEYWSANAAYDHWVRLSAWGLPFYVLGRLLIGAAIGRTEAFRDPLTHRARWARWCWIAFALGAACTLVVILRDQGHSALASPWWRTEPGRATLRILRSTGSLSLGLAYFAGFVWLAQGVRGSRLVDMLAPVGRMALTNYLLQTVVGLGLFYGFAAGLRVERLGPLLLLGLAVFAVQIVLSRWWLRRFQFGPVEWLWRAATRAEWPRWRTQP